MHLLHLFSMFRIFEHALFLNPHCHYHWADFGQVTWFHAGKIPLLLFFGLVKLLHTIFFLQYHSLVSSPRSEESNILSLKSPFEVMLTTCALITESSTALISLHPASADAADVRFNCTKCCCRRPGPRGCGTGGGGAARAATAADSPCSTGSVSYAFSDDDDGGWLMLPSSSGRICFKPYTADRVLLLVSTVRLL